jgi:hypothetical protein
MIIWTAMLFILISWPITAFSQVEKICGEPPPVANESLKGAIKGEAQALSRWLGNAGLTGQIQTSREEIFSKYPDAEVSRSNAYFEYVICVILMQDKSLTSTQKIEELKKIHREFSKPFERRTNKQGLQPPPPVKDGNLLAELREDHPDWVIHGSNYNLVDRQLSSNGLFTAYVGDSNWDNYVVEFDVKKLVTSTRFEFGVLIRRQSDTDYVGLQLMHFVHWHPCYARWVIAKGGKETVVVNSEMRYDCADQDVHYRIEVDGNRYKLFKDGSQMFVFNNNTFTNGGVGFKSVNKKLTFIIDNFKVVSLRQ